MSKYAKEYRSYYPKTLGAVVLCIGMSFYLITRSDKPRTDFIHQAGTISHLSSVNPLYAAGKPKPKDRYLVLAEQNRVFELFVGTDKGDFSPRVNRLSELKVGDKVDVYYEENHRTQNESVNRLLQYLDKMANCII